MERRKKGWWKEEWKEDIIIYSGRRLKNSATDMKGKKEGELKKEDMDGQMRETINRWEKWEMNW